MVVRPKLAKTVKIQPYDPSAVSLLKSLIPPLRTTTMWPALAKSAKSRPYANVKRPLKMPPYNGSVAPPMEGPSLTMPARLFGNKLQLLAWKASPNLKTPNRRLRRQKGCQQLKQVISKPII